MRRWLSLLLLAHLGAAAPALDPLLTSIDLAQKDLRSLKAEFVQRNRIKLFKQELVSRGRLHYQRQGSGPPQLLWEYLEPDPSSLLLQGKQATLRMAGRPPQVFDMERDATMRAIFDELLLWLGNGSLRAAGTHYEMAPAGDKAAPAVALVPRSGTPLSRTFTRIELRVDPRTMLLKGILLVEKSGDEKEIVFTHMERKK